MPTLQTTIKKVATNEGARLTTEQRRDVEIALMKHYGIRPIPSSAIRELVRHLKK